MLFQIPRSKPQPLGRITDIGLNLFAGGIQDHCAVPATGCATAACCAASTGGSGFQFGGGVEAGGDGLLQFADGQLWVRCGGDLWRVGYGSPLRIAAQVKSATIAQFKADHAFLAGHYLVAGEQAIAFNQQSAGAFGGEGKDLAYDTFDDGDNSAHDETPGRLWAGFLALINGR